MYTLNIATYIDNMITPGMPIFSLLPPCFPPPPLPPPPLHAPGQAHSVVSSNSYWHITMYMPLHGMYIIL